MTPPKVLITDSISPRGIHELAADGALEVTVRTGLGEPELIQLIPDFSAIVVRSATKVTAPILQAATRLRVVGRAGVGVALHPPILDQTDCLLWCLAEGVPAAAVHGENNG